MNFLTTVGVYVLIAIAFYTFLILGISLLPVGQTLPDGFVSAVNLFFSYLRGFDFLMPMSALFSVLVLLLGFNLVMFTIKAIFWVIHLVRGSKK